MNAPAPLALQPSAEPLGPGVAQSFWARTVDRADHVALVCGEQRVTYGELGRQVRAWCRSLREAGVGPQDRVILLLDTGLPYAAALHALWSLGAVAVPLPARTAPDRLAVIEQSVEPRVVISEDTAVPVPNRSGDEAQPPSPPGDALATLIHTSGSTGQPKAVMLSHAHMRAAWHAVLSAQALRADDVIGLALPPMFSYGLYQLTVGLGVGATVVLERQAAFPTRLMQRWQAERITVFPAVPALLAALLGLDAEATDLPSLRLVTNAAAPLPPAHLEALRRRWFGARFQPMYGLTECKRVSMLDPDEVDAHPHSVGRGLPGQRHWIVDAHGQPVPPGAVGELVVAGPHVMQGYWRQPEATARRLRTGPDGDPRTLFTGDLFRADTDGHLHFVGRVDDVFKSGGEKVAPVEIEHALCTHPDVAEAAVAGQPDERLGLAVHAWVRCRAGAQPGERDLIRHCRGLLDAHKVPKQIHFVPELPTTASGKVQRQRLHVAAVSVPRSEPTV